MTGKVTNEDKNIFCKQWSRSNRTKLFWHKLQLKHVAQTLKLLNSSCTTLDLYVVNIQDATVKSL